MITQRQNRTHEHSRTQKLRKKPCNRLNPRHGNSKQRPGTNLLPRNPTNISSMQDGVPVEPIRNATSRQCAEHLREDILYTAAWWEAAEDGERDADGWVEVASRDTTGDVDCEHEAEAPGPALGFEGSGFFLRG